MDLSIESQFERRVLRPSEERRATANGGPVLCSSSHFVSPCLIQLSRGSCLLLDEATLLTLSEIAPDTQLIIASSELGSIL